MMKITIKKSVGRDDGFVSVPDITLTKLHNHKPFSEQVVKAVAYKQLP